MNILIVGNGFDLSHYLPTKYDHFMDVMRAIEEKDTGGLPKNLEEMKIDEWLNLIDKTFQKREGMEQLPHHMNFDELFSKIRDPNFIEKTKEFYLTENIEICAKNIVKLQYRLELNCWYQYFKKHVEEIKTWIDFEQKIQEVLKVVAKIVIDLEKINNPKKIYEYFSEHTKDGNFRIKEKNSKILNFFNFTAEEEYYQQSINLGRPPYKSTRVNLNPRFCHGESILNDFSPSLFLDFLSNQLDDFIEIFNLYLELIVSNLNRNCDVNIRSEDWLYPDKVYSFNYTNTYQRIHDNVAVDFLHGSSGEEQNIVLGVSDLNDESLKKLKAFGFTKYHQKLFNETDYLFLDSYKSDVARHKRKIEYFEKDFGSHDPLAKKFERQNLMELESKLNLNFFIWGHSLDLSDQDYIQDIFSLNDDIDRNVRVIIYYFDKNAKFALLNNLLAILKKDKVEQWMKNKWLQFKPNPEIKFTEAIL